MKWFDKLFNMKIVKFDNGKYAVRRQILCVYEYKSIVSTIWWSHEDVESYCQGTLEKITVLFKSLTDYGKEVKGCGGGK